MQHASRLRRIVAGSPFLAAALAAGLLFPTPEARNEKLAEVIDTVRERLPGWRVIKATEAWESGWAIVATCGRERLGFQWIPDHGLPIGDAWIQPTDPQSRGRLFWITDHPPYLLWRQQPVEPRTLGCNRDSVVSEDAESRAPSALE